MASEQSSNKTPQKKRNTTQKKDERKGLIDSLKNDLKAKNYANLSQITRAILDLNLTVEEAKDLVTLNVHEMIDSISGNDHKQAVIFFVGVINEKIKKFDVAISFFLKIGEVYVPALDRVISILEQHYNDLKNNSSLRNFLTTYKNSEESSLVHLRALCEIQKIYSQQQKKTSILFNKKSEEPSDYFDNLKNYLSRLKKNPQRFFKVIESNGQIKKHLNLVQAVLSVFDKPEKEVCETFLQGLNIIDAELYDKPPLNDQLIAVIKGFLPFDKEGKFHRILAEVYEKNGRIVEAQEIRKNLQSSSDYEESHQVFSEEKEDEGVVFEEKDVEFQKATVKRLKEEALARNKDSMQRLLEYSKNKKFTALAEVWEALGEIYVAIGNYKKDGKSPFEYAKKNVPEKCFDEARGAYEKFYKNKPRPGIYYDLAIKYREGRLFRKNTFLARRFLEEGRKNHDLDTNGLILLASMYFLGEGGIEEYDEAKKILSDLNRTNLLEDQPEALYILAECEYLFYLDAKIDNDDAKASTQKKLAQAFFQASSSLGHSAAALCLQLFVESETQENVPEAMDIDIGEDEQRDGAETGLEDHDSHKVEKLLTELCEALRVNENDEEHDDVVSLRDRLVALDASYEKCTPKNFFEKLRTYETEQGTYFDKEVSDDSDSDRDEEYHGNDHAITAKKRDANKLIDKLRKQTHEFLDILEKGEEEKLEKNYDDHASKFRSKYTPILKSIEVNKNPSIEARLDLETVADYAARGKLHEALAQISTPFYVVQTRGLHFFVNKWSRSQRHTFKRNIYDKTHPLLNQPIYSASAHVLAQVEERFPEDELFRLKLQQAARCLSYRLRKLKDVSPHSSEELPAILKSKSIVDRKYRNRLMQVQQLYSGKYDAFLKEYLAWEIKQTPHFFANQEMHFVSTADIQSKHSAEYAMGNKYYPSKKDLRLRPRYNSELRASKPHVGALLLTVQPLEDYLPDRHNHIPSLNTQGEIELSELIVAERECTFFGSIPKDRLSHIEAMRFPSFHHDGYLEIMRHRYGLDKELYDRFKKLLAESKPHMAKNRLTILLLGEHISAYKTLALQKRADELVRERGSSEYLKKADKAAGVLPKMKEEGSDRPYLLYRTPLGNFSFFSDQPYAATPNGDNVFLRSRRFQTAALRKAARASGYYSDEESSGEEVKKEKAIGKVTTLGDGNCAFNAVTLGVCELLEQGLLLPNLIFEAELSAKLDIQDPSREALIEAIKKVKGDEERQLRFQPLMRQIAIKYIEDHYDAYRDGYHERLIQAFNNFNDPEKKEEDQIFCVHNFIRQKFSEEELSEEALIVWWENNGKQQYFAELRQSARKTMDRARWGSEIEIDAFGKFLMIKISWKTSRMDSPRMIGAFDEDGSVVPAFGVYFSGEHWTYVRLSQPETTMNPEDQKDGHDEVVRSESDYEEQRRISQTGEFLI